MKLIKFLFIFILQCISAYSQPPSETKETLLNGWYLWDPYQYAIRNDGAGETLTGLDIELVKAITTAAKYKVIYEPV